MKVHYVITTLTLVSLAVAGAIPKPNEHKERVIDKDLSDQKHFDDEEEHNPEYDHEAFLGKDEARDFDDLSPEESKERLAAIFDKIDKDKDGKVSEDELKNWIKYVQNKYIIEDTDRQWKDHLTDDEGMLTWAKYKERTYGYLESKPLADGGRVRHDGVVSHMINADGEEDQAHYKEMIDRDERRWKRANKRGDGKLTKEEFMDFLHPEEADHMKDIVVEETLEDIDKDKDGFISEEEYIGDFYPDSDGVEPEPEWVQTERETFHKEHDKDGDGRMDTAEIMKWIIPDDYDHTVAESKHLLSEADSDKDGFLTKEEVVNKYDLFVGSQATDFGEALTRHDEF